jgi:hypothetical protein
VSPHADILAADIYSPVTMSKCDVEGDKGGGALDTDDNGERMFFCQICCEEYMISMATLCAANKFLFVLRCADLNQNK